LARRSRPRGAGARPPSLPRASQSARSRKKSVSTSCTARRPSSLEGCCAAASLRMPTRSSQKMPTPPRGKEGQRDGSTGVASPAGDDRLLESVDRSLGERMGDATPVRDRVAGGERDRGCTTSFLPFLVPRYRRKQDTRNGRGPAVPVVQRLTPSPCGAHM